MFRRVKGTRDILPEEILFWRKTEETCTRIFSSYGYEEIRTPLMEEFSLFCRSLGKTTEVVKKQMFEIKRGSGHLVLRPEATASIVRAYLENRLDRKRGLAKFYYVGAMFRAERQQKGRLRQFHHLGVEAIGSNSPNLDIEIISLLNRLVKELNIEGYQIYINSLGCIKDKQVLAKILHYKITPYLDNLCADCKRRFKQNVFRILDCKKPECMRIVNKLELGTDHLCDSCKKHLESVLAGLDTLGIGYKFEPALVRGLDYYTRTIFEIKHPRLGSQDALGAGGRYDNLVAEFGGPELGAIGFALGEERLLLAQSRQPQPQEPRLVTYLITLGEEADKAGVKLLDKLREQGIASDMDYTEGRSLKGKMRRADELGVRLTVIIGEDELKKGTVTLKDMVSGKQEEVKIDEVTRRLKCYEPIRAES